MSQKSQKRHTTAISIKGDRTYVKRVDDLAKALGMKQGELVRLATDALLLVYRVKISEDSEHVKSIA